MCLFTQGQCQSEIGRDPTISRWQLFVHQDGEGPRPIALPFEAYPMGEKNITVRVIVYQIPGFRPARLVTSMIDPAISALALVRHYHQRWDIEILHPQGTHKWQIDDLRCA